MIRTAFYATSDSRYFVGLVALLNSLRLVGHGEPVFVLDSGLDERQRALLAPHVQLIPAPPSQSRDLVTGKHLFEHPADVMVVVDADMIVVRSLAPLLAKAAEGKFVAAADDEPDRFHYEWDDLGSGPLQRHTYVSFGLVAFPRSPGLEILERVGELQAGLDLERTRLGHGSPSDPFYYYDQDLLNAVLGMEGWTEALCVLDHRLIPFMPGHGLHIVDPVTLDCRYSEGESPFAIHHVGRGKPWFARTAPNVYSRLLPRLVLADDVAVQLDERDLPLRFRPGARGRLDLIRTAVQTRIPSIRKIARERLSSPDWWRRSREPAQRR